MRCMAHHMNLVVQTLSTIPLVKCIESLLQTLHTYFVHSPKRHLEFTKLAKIMETKGNKILCNMKTQWISMLSLVKIIVAKYITLLLKMAMDNSTNQQVNIILNIIMTSRLCSTCACILPLLEFVHDLIKFVQIQDIFVYDLVAIVKVCKGDLYNMYCDQTSKFAIDSF